MSEDIVDISELSDEELMNMETPPPASAEEDDATVDPDVATDTEDNDTPSGSEDDVTGTDPSPSNNDPDGSSSDDSHTTPHQSESSSQADDPIGDPANADPEPTAAPAGDAASADAPNYEELYKQITAPFKANGRDFQVRNPEEAVRLMQQGAHYTKKMQALKPQMRVLRMLENNDLMDESQLSFLIDLNKKDPAAIQKLLHDGKVDPLDIDVSSEPAYQPGNHQVSDQEIDFSNTLSDVQTTETGKETVSHIHSTWDQASKQALYQDPQLLQVINEQRASGIYDQISAEVHRQQTLGHLTNIPFIHAYKLAGDTLQQQGKLGAPAPAGGLENPTPAADPATPAAQPVVVGERAAKPDSQVNQDARVRAASPPRTSPKTPTPPIDLNALSDDEILKMSAPPR